MANIDEYITSLKIIDGHEHLWTQERRRKEKLDFFGLFHYLDSDLTTAGMERDVLKRHFLSDEEKAKIFLEYWQKTNNTTYAQMLRWAVEDLYGMNDWTVDGLLALNEKVREASQNPNWYNEVLREKSKIDIAITLIQTTKVDFELFRPVMFLDFTAKLRSLKDIEEVERISGLTIHTFRDYLNAVDALMDKYVNEGMVATKLGIAYWRTLLVQKALYHEAEKPFNALLSSTLSESLSQSELKPLQDYIIHHVIQRSIDHRLPIQIHTGHQEPSVSSNGNTITNSNVSLLVPLLLEYKEAKFVLLHSGYPYYAEYLSIAKNFPNVYADLTWLYIISPTASRHVLHQMIEMVPQSKILAFGGDYSQVEGTYAHAKLMRRILAGVLKEKVNHGDMTEKDAFHFAELVLRDNLITLYNLQEVAVRDEG